jgi:hypothetical protein
MMLTNKELLNVSIYRDGGGLGTRTFRTGEGTRAGHMELPMDGFETSPLGMSRGS